MRGLRTASFAHKKPDTEMLKKRKADAKPKNEKASKKNSDAPKRPAGAFFIFMEEFRKSFKENAENKTVSGSAVGKAGGEKWKSMSESEKAPYVAKAAKRKEEYEKALEEYKKKLNGNGEEDKPEESSEKSTSTSEIHNVMAEQGRDQEASS